MTFASNIFALHPVARCRMPELIPPKLDDLLDQRRTAERTASLLMFDSDLPARMAVIQNRYVNRLNAHIERKDKA